MAFERQLTAFGGIVLLGSILYSDGQALAFGQQWRPTPGYGATSPGSFDRVAGTPNFRPRTLAGQAKHRPYGQIPQRRYRPRSYRGLAQPRRLAALQAYRTPQINPPYFTGLYPAHAPAAVFPVPAWGMPFTPMMQPWGQHRPLFANQYAWRSARQPWITRVPPMPEPRYRARRAPTMVGNRHARARVAPPAGSWRPTPAMAPRLAQQRRFDQRPFRAGGATTLRAGQSAAQTLPDTRVAGLNPASAGTQHRSWRPHAGPTVSPVRREQPFRPRNYGRSLGAAKALAGRDQEAVYTRNGLPGWVTTYEDSLAGGSCSWCSDS